VGDHAVSVCDDVKQLKAIAPEKGIGWTLDLLVLEVRAHALSRVFSPRPSHLASDTVEQMDPTARVTHPPLWRLLPPLLRPVVSLPDEIPFTFRWLWRWRRTSREKQRL
jgi:hypothetical protein